MNQLADLGKENMNALSNLANEIIDKKWPAKDNDSDLFNFVFECFNFLRVFFLIGIKLCDFKLI